MYLAAGASDGRYARLYAKSGTDWNMIQQINGTDSWSLDFSHEGSMLTIGSTFGAV